MIDEPTMKIIEFKKDATENLEVLKNLTEKVQSGEITSFAAVGITKDNQTYMWSGGSHTTLIMLGALENLKQSYWSRFIND